MAGRRQRTGAALVCAVCLLPIGEMGAHAVIYEPVTCEHCRPAQSPFGPNFDVEVPNTGGTVLTAAYRSIWTAPFSDS
jgi:hypothetical protein